MERSPVVFRIPMRERFRGQTVREGVLIHGPAGWGEFSPFPEYGPRECSRWLACAREAADEGWPVPVRAAVPVNSTIPAVPPDKAFQLVRQAGCATAKVKVAERGQSFAEDLARVEAVRDALGPSGKLRVDANGAWSVDEALSHLKALDRFDLEYAEQPCATLGELAQVRRRCDVPIAADESIRKAEDPLRVRAAEAADIAVVKVQPLGGVRNALRVVEACGLPAVVSSAVESSVGLAAGLALAAALPELPYACGLGTMTLLSGDVVKDSLMPVDGQIAVRRPNVDFSYLSEFEIESPSWLRRMQEAAS
ncbi:O-succinylbenzoate synthase [Nonomuraea endophytica]|uniref:o-succinylbenzoate synthase n=1 Tax=Nonomuraea endophytica TaxID=714136 RepID=A0A7W8AEB0_9ACTN|nr:o-succinylbenzoate synthase [Nonomuraea endophytica]MBB5084707.1 O-succinylbenzoate synthase [Nonomuraea endophytica]